MKRKETDIEGLSARGGNDYDTMDHGDGAEMYLRRGGKVIPLHGRGVPISGVGDI